MRVLGVDPGKHGAWALLDEKGALLAADHFPLGADGEIDGARLYATWRSMAFDLAAVEEVGSMGGEKNGRRQGVQGMFNFGRRYGVVLTLLQVLGVRRLDVRPAAWKAACGVTANKGSSLDAARGLWPAQADMLLARVKDEARAEAALIARHGQRGYGVTTRRAA